MQTLYEKMGGTYSANEEGIDYPDLEVAKETEPYYGKYGMMRKAFLKEHQSGRYMSLLLTGRLTAHLNEIDGCANERVDILVRQMKEDQNISEELKELRQFEWVSAMNHICAAAEEIVMNELIYK